MYVCAQFRITKKCTCFDERKRRDNIELVLYKIVPPPSGNIYLYLTHSALIAHAVDRDIDYHAGGPGSNPVDSIYFVSLNLICSLNTFKIEVIIWLLFFMLAISANHPTTHKRNEVISYTCQHTQVGYNLRTWYFNVTCKVYVLSYIYAHGYNNIGYTVYHNNVTCIIQLLPSADDCKTSSLYNSTISLSRVIHII